MTSAIPQVMMRSSIFLLDRELSRMNTKKSFTSGMMSPNNRMQRSGMHKVLGRGRGHAVVEQVTSARVLERTRPVADAGRWATLRGAMMSAIKNLLICLFAFISSAAVPAEGSRSVLTRVGSASFWIDLPGGWEMHKRKGSSRTEMPLFDLAPAGSKPPEEYPGATTLSITAVYYPNRTPLAAWLRWEAGAAIPKQPPETGNTRELPSSTELPRIDGLSEWSLYGYGKTLGSAYVQIGNNALIFQLRYRGDVQAAQGQKVLLEVLKSYREARAGE